MLMSQIIQLHLLLLLHPCDVFSRLIPSSQPHCCDHPGCPSGYTRKSDLTRHQRETHRDQTSTRNTTFHEYKVTGPCQYKANSNKHQ